MDDGKPSIVEILKHLDRSNCRECGVPTCIAFAALVLQGKQQLGGCPRLAPEIAEELSARVGAAVDSEQARRDEVARKLKSVVRDVDLASAARRVGAAMNGDRIVIRCLGKRFELDQQGNLYSECHVNPWIHLPLLHYVSHCPGRRLTGEWVSFRSLPESWEWVGFFEHRCEGPIRRIIDRDPELFLDTLDLFSGEPIESGTSAIYSMAEIVMVLRPLPMVPILVAYWSAEGEFESRLNLLFDRSAGDNLGAEAIFRLCTGIVEMLKKIMLRHGYSCS